MKFYLANVTRFPQIFIAAFLLFNGILCSNVVTRRKSVSILEHPYLVAIECSEHLICAGSIVGSKWILTAAHCLLDRSPADVVVRYGATNRFREGVLAQVKQFFINRRFDVRTTQNDIALLELKSHVNISESAKMIEIATPVDRNGLTAGTVCSISGWGSLTTYGDFSAELHSVNVPVWLNEECQRAYENVPIDSDKLCAGTTGKDSCQADSGAPLVCNGKQYGLVSWGRACGDPKHPGVYTDVTYFREWIRTTMMATVKTLSLYDWGYVSAQSCRTPYSYDCHYGVGSKVQDTYDRRSGGMPCSTDSKLLLLSVVLLALIF